MKLFFALRLQESIRNRLEQLMLRMHTWDMPADWVNPYDLHITLAYLGEWPDDGIKRLISDVDLLLASQTRPPLTVPGLAAFAGKKWPRIVYAAIEDGEQRCADLHQDLCGIAKMKKDRQFVPHITLCRPKSFGLDKSWDEFIEAFLALEITDVVIEDIALLSSHVQASPRYRLEHAWSFID